MNNNEILVRKAIEDKEREANSYEDQECYNAAYCYGYAAGATDALSDPKELFIILSYYSNEDDGEFDRVGSCDKVYPTLEAAKAAADKLFKEDKENRPENIAVAYTLDDCVRDIEENPLYVVGEWQKNAFGSYHNFYAVCLSHRGLNARRIKKMLKVLGGRCRSIPVVDGKVNLVLKAVVPAPADKEKAEKLCSLNGWAPHTDMFNNLLITAPVSLDAYRLSDSSVMNAYIGFAEKAATALVGNKNGYLMAGVASYGAVG